MKTPLHVVLPLCLLEESFYAQTAAVVVLTSQITQLLRLASWTPLPHRDSF